MTGGFDPFNRSCPSRTVLDTVADRWAVLVLAALEGGEARFVTLRERVDGISPKMLTRTLRALEADGLAARREIPGGAPAVAYRLTDLGATAAPLAVGLVGWARTHAGAVLSRRTAHSGLGD